MILYIMEPLKGHGDSKKKKKKNGMGWDGMGLHVNAFAFSQRTFVIKKNISWEEAL